MLQGITVNLYRSIIPAGRSLFVLPNVCCGISGASTCSIIAFICATINLAPFFQQVELAAYFGLCTPAANSRVKKYEDRSRSLIELLQLSTRGRPRFGRSAARSDQR